MKDYIVNPTFRPLLLFTTRVKSGELKQMQIDIGMLPQMANLMMKVASLRGNGAAAEELEQQLEFLTQSGIIVSAEVVPGDVVPRFPLSEELLPFVPAKFQPAETLVVNRDHVFIQRSTARPAAPFQGIPPETTFPTDPPFVWVFDPGTKMWAAYHADVATIAIVEKLLDGGSIEDIATKLRDVFAHARIVIPPDHVEQRQAYWNDALEQARSSIEHDGFAAVRDILAPLQIAAARSYARGMEREGYLQLDRHQVTEKRFFKHNDELFRFLHRQTGHLLRRVTGETIIPSYSYLSAYREDAELAKHKDRPQCAWNASLLIDTNRDGDDGRSWPIYIDTARGQQEIRLDLGDAVVYRGSEVAHWRPRAAPGERQTLVLLHYVPFDFTGSLD